APAHLPGVRPRGVLRQLPPPPRHRALPRHRPPGDALRRARRRLGLVLRGRSHPRAGAGTEELKGLTRRRGERGEVAELRRAPCSPRPPCLLFHPSPRFPTTARYLVATVTSARLISIDNKNCQCYDLSCSTSTSSMIRRRRR